MLNDDHNVAALAPADPFADVPDLADESDSDGDDDGVLTTKLYKVAEDDDYAGFDKEYDEYDDFLIYDRGLETEMKRCGISYESDNNSDDENPPDMVDSVDSDDDEEVSIPTKKVSCESVTKQCRH
jgi:hypothetical protein